MTAHDGQHKAVIASIVVEPGPSSNAGPRIDDEESRMKGARDVMACARERTVAEHEAVSEEASALTAQMAERVRDEEEAALAEDRCRAEQERILNLREAARDRTEPHWVTDREGYFIEQGLRRRQWQRQQHQKNDGVSTSSSYEPPAVSLIERGLRRRQRLRHEDDRGRGDLMDKSEIGIAVRLPFAMRLATGRISALELAAIDAADDADNARDVDAEEGDVAEGGQSEEGDVVADEDVEDDCRPHQEASPEDELERLSAALKIAKEDVLRFEAIRDSLAAASELLELVSLLDPPAASASSAGLPQFKAVEHNVSKSKEMRATGRRRDQGTHRASPGPHRVSTWSHLVPIQGCVAILAQRSVRAAVAAASR